MFDIFYVLVIFYLVQFDYCRSDNCIEYANYTVYYHCFQLIQSVYQIFLTFNSCSPFENTYILSENVLILKMNLKTFMLHLFSNRILKMNGKNMRI